MMTDSHCHLASHRFDPTEISSIIQRAHAAGVNRLVTLATCLDDLQANLKLATEPGIHACIGIHPCNVHHAPDDVIDQLAAHTADPRVCAIGETGLDYFHPAPDGWTDDAFRQRQRDLLDQHFQLATRVGLNVVIHTRDREGHASFEDALAIYDAYRGSSRAIFHCFIGPWDNAERVIAAGGLVSFGGVATFKNAATVRDTACRCPAGSFLLETDSPYLSPEPHRGERNEPARVSLVAARLAAERGETLAELCHHTELAAERFFRFRKGSNEMNNPARPPRC
jgi:TatD DNase family protein